MGTREADQPVEQWSGPESLDPTPVWKQYILVALLLFLGLAVVIAVSVTALAPLFVTPPALVPGDRLVLAAADVAQAAQAPKRIGSPFLDDQRAFWLAKAPTGIYSAVLTYWVLHDSDRPNFCQVHIDTRSAETPKGLVADCGLRGTYHFSADGIARDSARDVDRYLVSVSGDRVIVNLSRVIQASERRGGPVPTGIPQPQQP